MSRVRLYRASGIVLRARHLGETDRLLTIFSRERGKLSAVAKGARRVASRLAAASQPFCHSSFQLAQGRNLDVVTQVVVRAAFYPIRDTLSRIAYAAYCCELVDTFTEERSRLPRLFDLLLAALSAVSTAPGDAALPPIARAFELRLLSLSGYTPQLDACCSCGRDVAGPASFSNALGGVVCPSCARQGEGLRRISAGALSALRALSKSTPSAPAPLETTRAQAAEIEACLSACIEYRSERKIRSARFLHDFAKR